MSGSLDVTVLVTVLVSIRIEVVFSLYWSRLGLGTQCLGLGLGVEGCCLGLGHALTELIPSLAVCVTLSLQVRSDTRQVRVQEAGRLRVKDQPSEQNRQSRTTGARVSVEH